MAILTLPPVQWQFQESVEVTTNPTLLGDGYSLTGAVPFSDRTNYNIVFPGLTFSEFNTVLTTFKSFSGWQTFQWRALDSLPYRTYATANISMAHNGNDTWIITVTLQEIR
ncbi:MAG: hypothetical protein V7L23_15340 [Nostoc sp.]|uniref:hypothetical protein n=1 Tax=Nostoc sp. TaxID=1180 RepID=UPI002FEF29E7